MNSDRQTVKKRMRFASSVLALTWPPLGNYTVSVCCILSGAILGVSSRQGNICSLALVKPPLLWSMNMKQWWLSKAWVDLEKWTKAISENTVCLGMLPLWSQHHPPCHYFYHSSCSTPLSAYTAKPILQELPVQALRWQHQLCNHIWQCKFWWCRGTIGLGHKCRIQPSGIYLVLGDRG